MVGNELLGESAITLEGVEYGLRPSYAAITAIEAQTGRSLLQLGDAAGSGALGHEQAAVIVAECMKAWGRSGGDIASPEQKVATQVNKGRVGELLMEAGLLLVAKRLEILLFKACTGGYTSSGEERATGTVTTETPAAA